MDDALKERVYTQYSDESELLRRLIDGDIGGFEVLFHRYYATFFAFVKGMTHDECVAEDIAQNIFMKVWLNREHLDAEKSIRNYLYVLAKHEVFNWLRGKNRLFITLREAMLYNEKSGVGSHYQDDTQEQIAYNETSTLIDAIVENMPQQRQRIFRMSRFENNGNKEIAEKLGISVRTVDKHLELAIREIRKHISVVTIIVVNSLLLH